MKIKSFFSVLLLMVPVLAFAHALPHDLTWKDGLVHPLTGLDHFVTMFGIGLLSFYSSDNHQHIFRLPIVFCSFLALAFIFQPGSLIGLTTIMPAILVIALGLLIIKAKMKYWVWALLPVIAFVHGHIHSSDVMALNLNFSYILCFLLTTFVLHVCGIFLAQQLHRLHTSSNTAVGGLFMLIGAYLLT